ncbi:hypothetical protein [Chryseobacterium gambrini]|uniref:hypothetical protein n=1 Tax=Chryseobacterium gambrini TaxID=373672 RepID=UPI0022F1ADCD|nr:hypothetical protein [Chryseobacterium gambrini]WBV51439.1 hypothetical protein PFY09_13995 [Chryseobacterium gambrini]
MKRFIINYINNLELTVSVVGDVLAKTFRNDNGLISDEGREILDNDIDRKSVEEAVDYLKKHSEVQNKEVELSDNRKILISIG